MEIRQTTPPDAYDTLERDPTAVYLDVRTAEEFADGSSPNPDFVAAVQRLVPPTTPLLVGCQAGGRVVTPGGKA